MSLLKYTLIVLGLVAGSQAALWPVLRALDAAARQAVLLGCGIAAANALLAHLLVLWAGTRRSTGGFLGAILGGMLGRMFAMLGAVVVAVLVFDLPRVPLAVSLLAYFTVLLVLELSVLHRHTPQPAEAR